MPWHLYLLECTGGGIYIGIAKDVDARYAEHAAGKGALYTRLFPPLRILGVKTFPDHRSAAQAERAFKKLPRWKSASGRMPCQALTSLQRARGVSASNTFIRTLDRARSATKACPERVGPTRLTQRSRWSSPICTALSKA